MSSEDPWARVDTEAHVCAVAGWTLKTSHSPKDLDAICAEVVERFSRP